jgi:hypothetical protein
MDLAGDPTMIIASCYYCYYFASNADYQLDITVFPADAGQAGDATQDVLDIILDMPDSPGSWNSQTDTFTLDGTDTVNVDITSCDSWCPYESSMTVTLPDGTVDSTGFWASGYTGTVGTYSDAGTYSITKSDSYGDGGFGVAVGSIAAVNPDDPIVLAYRCHGHALARGMDPKFCMAEMFGRIGGCAKGKGGSMHMFDAEDKLKLYANAEDIIKDYYVKRLELYEKRKEFLKIGLS